MKFSFSENIDDGLIIIVIGEETLLFNEVESIVKFIDGIIRLIESIGLKIDYSYD